MAGRYQKGKQNKTIPAWRGWVVFGVVAIGVFALGMLFASILERRQEARVQAPLVTIDRFESDSEKWSVNWPREYASYLRMRDDTTRTKYAGAYPRDYLAETTENVILFAGYPFSIEYLQARGHVYSVEDVTSTDRLSETTVATCWTCKSADVPRLMAHMSGREDIQSAPIADLMKAGAGTFYDELFSTYKEEITHPIGCRDCHEPETMQLTISRPALIEAFERQGRSIDEVSHQEMRSLVCAQCHVEYYFKDTTYLTFPWDKGVGPEAMHEYFNEISFQDWTHAVSQTPMVKMQHPDYELYSTGIHAYRNVACADCHMPYRTEGGMKFTDHHLQSPLLNIANSCAVCHRWSEEDIRSRVESIQDKTREGRDRVEQALIRAHFDIAACMQAGIDDAALEPLRALVRQGQLYWDFIAASNGMGFHSPHEALRILNAALEKAQECRVIAARLLAAQGYTEPIEYPDISTKEKAQAVAALFTDGNPPNLLITTSSSDTTDILEPASPPEIDSAPTA